MKSLQLSETATVKITCFENYQELAAITAPYLIQGTAALSGGSTFSNLYPLWLQTNKDFSNTSFFCVDERLVPFKDSNSNWGKAVNSFLIPAGRKQDKDHFAESLAVYKNILTSHFEEMPPKFNVIMLGVGEDGHTASLFPGGDYFNNQQDSVLQTTSPKPPLQRVTLAPLTIQHADEVLVFIAGENKKHIVEQLLNKNFDLPIVKILGQRPASHLFVQKSIWPNFE